MAVYDFTAIAAERSKTRPCERSAPVDRHWEVAELKHLLLGPTHTTDTIYRPKQAQIRVIPVENRRYWAP